MGKAGILVVEDDRDSREMLAELLMLQGYHSIMAANGREALRKLEHVLPDLVVTDLMMPAMTGADLLRQMARDTRFSAIPTIVLSSLDEAQATALLGDDLRTRAALVTKPIRIGPFLDLVKRSLAGAAGAGGGGTPR